MVKIVDLFAGIGGARVGVESVYPTTECLLSADIKKHAIQAYNHAFSESDNGPTDITELDSIPADVDILLGGFPCQPFSSAGLQQGFKDPRGNLIHHVARLLMSGQPKTFILENVENIVTHDKGETLKSVVKLLEDSGYNVKHKVLNAVDFGVPQSRRRCFFVGIRRDLPDVDIWETTQPSSSCSVRDVLTYGQPTIDDEFCWKLIQKFPLDALYGRAIKDKRGGDSNIHSWDIGIKGDVTEDERRLLNLILCQRRQKKWSESKGIRWMDGVPLTYEEIRTFAEEYENLRETLDRLVSIGYLRLEHPRDIDPKTKKRTPRQDIEKGYNITTGKLSFPITKILDPTSPCPTFTATDMCKLGVYDIQSQGIRRLSVREALLCCGFPPEYSVDETLSVNKWYDLIGNMICPPVIASIAKNLRSVLE